eukprot:TRINITY_DN88219_c0_g1_i1.p2 TRINITY_DN88219_c0_g1~~TRINITY_DN88219_c0_g1_i1.p2  ORF type:complete len:116 (+),score=7.05 TRINITY_DN88219_c0_g1_i1:373-720(+)
MEPAHLLVLKDLFVKLHEKDVAVFASFNRVVAVDQLDLLQGFKDIVSLLSGFAIVPRICNVALVTLLADILRTGLGTLKTLRLGIHGSESASLAPRSAAASSLQWLCGTRMHANR